MAFIGLAAQVKPTRVVSIGKSTFSHCFKTRWGRKREVFDQQKCADYCAIFRPFCRSVSAQSIMHPWHTEPLAPCTLIEQLGFCRYALTTTAEPCLGWRLRLANTQKLQIHSGLRCRSRSTSLCLTLANSCNRQFGQMTLAMCVAVIRT